MVCLAASMALVGSYVALSKPLLQVFPVYLLAWLRFAIGGLAMVGWLRKPTDEQPLTGKLHRLLFLEALLGNFLFSLFMLAGMRLSSAVSAGVIMAAIPAMVAFLSLVFLRETLHRTTIAAIVCAVLGIALLAWARPDASASNESSSPWPGNALLLAAVVCEAAYAVIGKRLTGALGARRITALVNLWGLALMTPLGLMAARDFPFDAVTARSWALLLFYSLAASVWSVWLWMTGLRDIPAHRAGVFTVMLPLSAATVGVLVLGESLVPLQLAAFALALFGVVLATRPSRSEAPPGA